MKRYPLYLSQEQIDRLALVLYRYQTMLDVVSPIPEPTLEAACFLTELRQQCCVRSGANDPFEELPLSPSFDGRRRHKDQIGQISDIGSIIFARQPEKSLTREGAR